MVRKFVVTREEAEWVARAYAGRPEAAAVQRIYASPDPTWQPDDAPSVRRAIRRARNVLTAQRSRKAKEEETARTAAVVSVYEATIRDLLAFSATVVRDNAELRAERAEWLELAMRDPSLAAHAHAPI